MKVTIKPINGINHTVVWHDESFITTFIESEFDLLNNGSLVKIVYNLDEEKCKHIATALPPLPRNPTPKDLRLLNYYESYGLTPMCGQTNILHRVYEYLSTAEWGGLWADYDDDYELSHAINDQNERVEIAITEGKGDE